MFCINLRKKSEKLQKSVKIKNENDDKSDIGIIMPVPFMEERLRINENKRI